MSIIGKKPLVPDFLSQAWKRENFVSTDFNHQSGFFRQLESENINLAADTLIKIRKNQGLERFLLECAILFGTPVLKEIIQAIESSSESSKSTMIPGTEITIDRIHFTQITWDKIVSLIKALEFDQDFIPNSLMSENTTQDVQLTSPADITLRFHSFQNKKEITPILQENEMECGATCLTIISRQFEELDRYHFRNLILPTKAGSSLAELIRAAERSDYLSSIVRCEFQTNPFGKVPFIALTDFHFVVVTSISNNSVHYVDPGLGSRKMSSEEARLKWSGYCLAISPSFSDFRSGQNFQYRDRIFDWNYRGAFFFLSVLVIMLSASTYIDRKLIRELLNHPTPTFGKLLITLLGLTLLYQFISLSLDFLTARVTAIKQLHSYGRFSSAMLMTTGFYQRLLNPKDILSRYEDLGKYVRTFFEIPGRFASRLLLLALFCFLLFELSPAFFLIICLATIMQGILIFHERNRQVHFSQMLAERFNEYESLLSEYLQGIRTLVHLNKSYAASELVKKKFDRYLEVEDEKLNFHNGLGLKVQLIDKVAMFSTVLLALHLYLTDRLGVGDIMVAVTTSMGVSDAIINYIIQSSDLLMLKVLHQRVIGLQEYPSNSFHALPFAATDNKTFSLNLKNLSFIYPGVTKRPALKNLNATLKGPGLYLLAGSSGSGKSTLAQIISGQFPELMNSSSIILSGTEFPELLRSTLFLSGDDPVLSTSLMKNLKLAKDGDEMKLIKFLTEVWNDPERKLDEYADRNLATFAPTLSSGQLQRLLFSRAVYQQPKLLILDECLSSVDPETEERIVSELKGLLPNSMVILVTHRLSLSIYADQVLLISQGTVLDQGTPLELLMNSAEFRYLFQQSRGTYA
jgi:ABC-type bacteriocin/lantibiotic exporter with double-glycine peptidase domain